MPEKAKRKQRSLEAKSFRAVLMGSLILGVVALIVGLGLYSYALGRQYISEAFEITRSTAAIIEDVSDPEYFCDMVVDTYRGMSEEDRNVQDEAYFAKFKGVENFEDYPLIMDILRSFYENKDINDLFIGFYDRESGGLLYIADPDEKRPCRPGTWEEIDSKEIEAFLNSNGEDLTYNITYTNKYGWLCTAGVPIMGADGEPYAFVLADVSMEELFRGMRDFALNYTVATVLTVLLLAFLLSRHIRKNMVEPLNQIADAAESYVQDRTDGDGLTQNHFVGLDIDTGDEIENLYHTLSDMEKDLNTYEEDLTRAVQEKERISMELNLAQHIQADMLPNVFPPFPDREDFDIYASMIPAKEVGGDFYDYFLIDDDHLCLVMADVSGKGVPAALFMMASMILLKTTAMSGLDPAEIITRVNKQICSNNSQEMFVTVWLGILELSTGKLTAANAGHEYPVIRQGSGSYELYKDVHGFVVGGLDDMDYDDYEVQLEPGSGIFLYTDGVTEATDEEGKLFGTDRIVEALNSGESHAPYDALKRVSDAVHLFAGEAPQSDDITMLCFSYEAAASDGEKGKEKYVKELTLEATVPNIPKVTEFVDAELEALDCPPKAQMQIDIAIDELFGNIAQYAYDPLTGPATVRVEVEEDPMAVIITFIDHGKPYDPLAEKDPDITLSAEDREVGGLGVFLVKKTMDDVSYEYKNGQNILKVRKNM